MKDELRYEFKIKRRCFNYSRREVADGAIYDNALAYFADKNSFFIYRSFGTEADTQKLISAFLCLGRRVFLPRVEGRDIVPVEYFEGRALKKSPLGMYEPEGQPFAGEPEVILAPLLAVNPRGYRLGYGGGYYDRYLKHTHAVKAGIAYDFQLTDKFIEDPWDEPLDILITEKGVYTFAN